MGASVPDPLYAARMRLEVERRLFGSAETLRVGRFEIGERIGAGGMSVIYAAHDPELGRRVALKLLQNGAHAERLSREARALARLRHANVVTVYDVGRWEEHLFLALEHVEGSTLARWRAASARTPHEVLRVALALADGLAAVHDLGLVHRDVKPDNVILDAHGSPRLVDFGLVTDGSDEDAGAGATPSTTEAGPLTRPGATPGTPRYIAPERLSGGPASPASDQFSFGVMLDELLEGTSADRDVRTIVRRARAERPGDRFPSMHAVRDAIARVVAPTRPAWWPLGLATLALVAGVVVLITRTPPEAPDALPSADAPLDAAAVGDPAGYAELSAGTLDADARRDVRAGLLALRDGQDNGAVAGFESAARRDPSYGAAHFWRALLASHGDVHGAQDEFARAFALRATMSPRLRAMLEALVPCIQAEPVDDAACEASLADASARMPDSTHLAYELARLRMVRAGPSTDVVAMYQRALDADPGFVRALHSEAQTLAYLGRFPEALALTDTCLAAVASADTCIHDRAWIHIALGDVDGVERDARALRAAQPTNALSYQYLAAVAAARGESVDVVRELLRLGSDRMPETMRARLETRDAIFVALLGGRFDAALDRVEALEASVASETDRATRLLGRRVRILVALETGDDATAARIAGESLEAMQAWAPDPRNEDFGIARDPTPFLLDVLRDTGTLADDERARRRDAWLVEWRARTPPFFARFLWLAAYARTTDDAHEAAEAMAALPAEGPPPFHPLTCAEAGIGRAYALAGRPDAALPYLRRAASSTHALEGEFGLENGWELVRANRDLGAVLEATGDGAGACAAYQRVLDRWGDASPRSLTADAARARRAALACD